MIDKKFIELVETADGGCADSFLFEPVKNHICKIYGRADGQELYLKKEICGDCKSSGLFVGKFSSEKLPCNNCKGQGFVYEKLFFNRFYLQDQLFRVNVTHDEVNGKCKQTYYNPPQKFKCKEEEAAVAHIILAGVFDEIIVEGTQVFQYLIQFALSGFYYKQRKEEIDAQIKFWREKLNFAAAVE